MAQFIFERTKSAEVERIQELKWDAEGGSQAALRELHRIGYQVITIKGKMVNLREMFEKIQEANHA